MPASARLCVWRTQNTADGSEEEQASSKSSILTDNRVFLSKGERKRVSGNPFHEDFDCVFNTVDYKISVGTCLRHNREVVSQ